MAQGFQTFNEDGSVDVDVTSRLPRLLGMVSIGANQRTGRISNSGITPNTNIYCCPFCKRKIRKKKFGDALRDKFVIGTIEKGIVREIDCDYCYLKTDYYRNSEDPMKRIKYKEIGGL